MFGLFKSKTPKTPVSAVSPAAHHAGASTRQHANVQRELVRVVLRDTLRHHGVPASWVGCEVSVPSRRASDADLMVELMVLKWNDQLIHHAPVLEKELLLALDRFDPSVDHTGYTVVWRFAPECGCPHTEMPPPKFWIAEAHPVAPAEPVAILDRRRTKRTKRTEKFDLPNSAYDNLPQNFAPTEPAPLR